MKNSQDSLSSELEKLSMSSHLKRWGRWAVGALAVFWILVFALWSALHILILPRIGEYREVLQKQTSQAIGLQVEVASIQAGGSWLVPWLNVEQVRLLDTQGQEAVQLPRVRVALSPLTLLRGKFDQVVIEGPQLNARRDAQGHVWVAGFDISAAGGDNRSAMDWLFAQPQWLVRDGRLTWRDAMRPQATELVLSNVSLMMQNGWRSHRFELKLTPPESLAQPTTLQAAFEQPWFSRAGDFSKWQGQVFADLAHIDVKALRAWMSFDRGISLDDGTGAVRVWLDVAEGQWVGAMADVALDTVNVRLGKTLKPLRLHAVSGRIGARWSEGETELSSQDLVFDTQEGEHWPGGELRVRWQGASFATGSLHADRLDLEALAQVSQRLPLSDDVHQMLTQVQPRGQVNQLQASWSRNGDEAQPKLYYSARGSVKQLHWQRDAKPMKALSQVPGIDGASIEFDLNQQGGKARVAIQQGSLTLPVGLEDPKLLLDDAFVALTWHIKDDGHLTVQAQQGRAANADAAGEFSGKWQMGEGERRLPGTLDLTVNLTRAKANKAYRYLPDTLSKTVRHYVAEAVKDGQASQIKLRLRGKLEDMPFNDPAQGEFKVSVKLAQGVYAYVPSDGAKPQTTWPALHNLEGELVFDRSALHFKGATQLAGAPHVAWQNVEVHIPNLAQTVVQVRGDAKGPLAEVLGVVQKTAINDLIGGVLDKSQASGDAQYKLALVLPIDALITSQVSGSVKFADNDLQIIPGTPVITKTKGQLQFTEKGFDLTDVRGHLLGSDARIAGGLSFAQANGVSPIQLKIEGEATAEGLRQAKELGFISKLAQQSKGAAHYAFELGLLGGQARWSVNSDLSGLALTLPAPLNKTASAKVPLRVESQLTADSLRPKSKLKQDQIKVTYGKQVNVMYVRDVSGPRVRVVSGAMTVGAASEASLRDGVVSMNLQLPFVDLDAWNDVLSQSTGTKFMKIKSKSIGLEASTDGAQDYLPTALNVKAEQLKISDRMVTAVAATGSRRGDLWHFDVAATELQGAIEVRPPNGDTPAQLYARLAYLVIPPSMVPDVESLLSEQPSSIPALDIVIDDLTLRRKKLGRLEIQAINRPGTNATREWRLNKFNATMPEATLTAHGNWAAEGKKDRRTQFKFGLEIRDAGKLLTRLGTPNALKEGAGRIEGDVSWQGSPITIDYASMQGQMNLKVEKGKFLKAEPGVTRLLGVLNLQALPRRFTLDFDDIFSDGFSFDFVRGDLRIERGIAYTNNLQMKGVAAGALIEGHVDLDNETQDLKVVVVPEINAGTASLYVATINPLVGLTSYLAQAVLSKPLIKAGTTEFHIDGSWVRPRVVKVE